MIKKNNSGNFSKSNLLIKKKYLPKLFISKSRSDLRTDKNYTINSKGKMYTLGNPFNIYEFEWTDK